MARRSSISSSLYRAARVTRTASAITSGKPSRVARRAANIGTGRALARVGFWGRLWR